MHLERALPKSVASMVGTRMKSLQRQIDAITASTLALKTKSPALNKAVELLTGTKGVGESSAIPLLAAMPELGKISSK